MQCFSKNNAVRKKVMRSLFQRVKLQTIKHILMKIGTITNIEKIERKSHDIAMLEIAKKIDKKQRKHPLRINSYTTILVTREKRTKKYARRYADKLEISYQP